MSVPSGYLPKDSNLCASGQGGVNPGADAGRPAKMQSAVGDYDACDLFLLRALTDGQQIGPDVAGSLLTACLKRNAAPGSSRFIACSTDDGDVTAGI